MASRVFPMPPPETERGFLIEASCLSSLFNYAGNFKCVYFMCKSKNFKQSENSLSLSVYHIAVNLISTLSVSAILEPFF